VEDRGEKSNPLTSVSFVTPLSCIAGWAEWARTRPTMPNGVAPVARGNISTKSFSFSPFPFLADISLHLPANARGRSEPGAKFSLESRPGEKDQEVSTIETGMRFKDFFSVPYGRRSPFPLFETRRATPPRLQLQFLVAYFTDDLVTRGETTAHFLYISILPLGGHRRDLDCELN